MSSTQLVNGARRSLSYFVIFTLVTLCLIQLTNTLTNTAHYTLQMPFQDQFRLTLRYITTPFPLSVFELENGHRPVIPGVLRWLELNYFSGRQSLQIVCAWGAAMVASGLLIRMCWREMDLVRVCAVACAITSTVLWNANARMFIHAYEATHVFLIFASLIMALALITQCGAVTKTQVLLASFAALVATLSFGPGIVVHGTVFGVLVLRRARWTSLVLALSAAFIAYVLYSYVLPGSDGVRGSSHAVSLGDTSYFFWLRSCAYWVEMLLPWGYVEGTRFGVCLTVFGAALAYTIYRIARLWLDRTPMSRCALVGAGIIMFGLVTNLLISVNRTALFLLNPADAIADRYLFWSALIWLGVAVFWLATTSPITKKRGALIVVAVACAAAFAVPKANWWRDWSSSTYRMVELTAVAYEQKIAHDHRIVEIAGSDIVATLKSIEIMRAAKVMAFASDAGDWMGQTLKQNVSTTATPRFASVESAIDTKNLPKETEWRIVDSEMPRLLAHNVAAQNLWLADQNLRVVGRCARTGSKRETRDYSRYLRPIYNQIGCYLRLDAAHPVILIGIRGQTITAIGELDIFSPAKPP
jgi:hypothetical protein